MYKFMSFEIHLSLDKQRYSRSTYSSLDWLGDVGGLFGILVSIGGLIVQPLSSYALQSALLITAFSLK